LQIKYTKQTVNLETHKSRACGNCGKTETKEGHDGCLGELPNVMNTCCGHGVESEAYIQFWGGKIIRGKKALGKIKEIKSIIND